MAQSARSYDLRDAHTQRWLNFVRSHAQAIAARDCGVVVIATFKRLSGVAVME
jgi:hypothetical protein